MRVYMAFWLGFCARLRASESIRFKRNKSAKKSPAGCGQFWHFVRYIGHIWDHFGRARGKFPLRSIGSCAFCWTMIARWFIYLFLSFRSLSQPSKWSNHSLQLLQAAGRVVPLITMKTRPFRAVTECSVQFVSIIYSLYYRDHLINAAGMKGVVFPEAPCRGFSSGSIQDNSSRCLGNFDEVGPLCLLVVKGANCIPF